MFYLVWVRLTLVRVMRMSQILMHKNQKNDLASKNAKSAVLYYRNFYDEDSMVGEFFPMRFIAKAELINV